METQTLRTSILKPLKGHLVKRGSLYAVLGGALLLFFGAFSPPLFLSHWGIWIWLAALLLIAWGLIPYKRITKLEEFPNKILLDEEKLTYLKGGKEGLEVRLQDIQDVQHVEVGVLYGVALKLTQEARRDLPEPSFMSKICLRKVKEKCDYDLFFPYFSKRSFNEIDEWFKQP